MVHFSWCLAWLNNLFGRSGKAKTLTICASSHFNLMNCVTESIWHQNFYCTFPFYVQLHYYVTKQTNHCPMKTLAVMKYRKSRDGAQWILICLKNKTRSIHCHCLLFSKNCLIKNVSCGSLLGLKLHKNLNNGNVLLFQLQ